MEKILRRNNIFVVAKCNAKLGKLEQQNAKKTNKLDFVLKQMNDYILIKFSTTCCCRQVAPVVSDSERPHRPQPTRLCPPWDSPGTNTRVGCHCLLQCMKVKCEREVAQSCLTLWDPMDCSLPGSSVDGIFQARLLEWVAIAFSVSTT